MSPSNFGIAPPGASGEIDRSLAFDDALDQQAAVSSALLAVFRGRFCDLILPNRKVTTFAKHQVIYEVGDGERRFFFLQRGFVKVGAISAAGHEVIYDVRKSGDVVGELCASEKLRPDRAVALEETQAIAVPYEEIMKLVLVKPELVTALVDVLCSALKEAYRQVNTLAVDDTIHRLINVLIGLAAKLGGRASALVEIPMYLTQEEIAQMVGARRERVSTALNALRRRGMVQYSTRGHLVLDVRALEAHAA